MTVVHEEENSADARGEDDDRSEDDHKTHWGSKWEFIFSCIGMSVGIGNVWRFPYLAYENGGGAFLFPYFLLLLVVGKPMYFMEVAVGQFAQCGPIKMWEMAPIGVGVGMGMGTISLIVAIYYNVLMGYCLHYIFASLRSSLPWDSCDPSWGADPDTCYVRSSNETCNSTVCETSTEQYWERYVLGLNLAYTEDRQELFNGTSDVLVNRTYALAQFGNIGPIKWDICLCLLLAWIVVFLCLFKGIQSSGKVVYFTATFPYVILLILFVRGLMLEGAAEGVWYFFVPEWKKLLEISVWRKAAEQMFYSLSLSWGGLMMFGSYNKFRNPVHHHAFAISILDFATSIIAGVVVFSILGELKRQLGVESIEHVVKSGQGLAFIVYPEVVSLMSLPQLWSVLFFFMLFLLGIDSQFALIETVHICINELFPATIHHRMKVTFFICASAFLISLPCVSYSGQFIFDLIDTYGGGLAVLWLAIFETIAIFWIYGSQRLAKDLGFMLNTNINYYWRFCWYITPIILIVIFSASIAFWTQPNYAGSLYYPDWAHGIGWFLTLIVALECPLAAIVVLIYYSIKKRPMDAFRPTPSWGPGTHEAREEWQNHKQTQVVRGKVPPLVLGYDNQALYYLNHHTVY